MGGYFTCEVKFETCFRIVPFVSILVLRESSVDQCEICFFFLYKSSLSLLNKTTLIWRCINHLTITLFKIVLKAVIWEVFFFFRSSKTLCRIKAEFMDPTCAKCNFCCFYFLCLVIRHPVSHEINLFIHIKKFHNLITVVLNIQTINYHLIKMLKHWF